MLGWHPEQNKILFASTRSSFQRFSRLFLISPDGTGLEELILHEAAAGSFSPDGSKIAYNKVSREFRTWKRYRGGTAQEVYLYDLETNEERNLTQFEGTDRLPMWVGDRIYFSSDRDRVLNLYSVDPLSGQIEQLTEHTEYDVRRPSAGPDSIVYELGGSLWLLDLGTHETRQIPVEIRSDAPETRPYFRDASDLVTGFDCSPTGKRGLLVARGDVFTVPKADGPTRNLSRSSGTRERGARWSPDGKTIAYFSDAGGEYEIWLADPLGKSEPVQLTTQGAGYRHTLRWSPDGAKIGFTDQTLRLFHVDVKTKKVVEVDRATHENVDVTLDRKPIFDYAWSPDSRFIAYSMMDADLVYKIWIYSLDSGKTRLVSDGLFNDFDPVFTPDGEHLLFVSNRRFDPTFCDFEWEMVYKKVAGVYALTLREDGPRFLPFRSDEEESSARASRRGRAEQPETGAPGRDRFRGHRLPRASAAAPARQLPRAVGQRVGGVLPRRGGRRLQPFRIPFNPSAQALRLRSGRSRSVGDRGPCGRLPALGRRLTHHLSKRRVVQDRARLLGADVWRHGRSPRLRRRAQTAVPRIVSARTTVPAS